MFKREPKTFDTPRLYYQSAWDHPGRTCFGGSDVPRLRIIYPKGSVLWLPTIQIEGYDRWEVPCWLEDYPLDAPHIINGFQSLTLMRVYDASEGWSAAEFIGEID